MIARWCEKNYNNFDFFIRSVTLKPMETLRGFELIEEMDTTRLRVRGRRLEELFLNSLRGMASCMKQDILSHKKRETLISSAVRVEAVDIASLLIEFLSEVIAQADMHGIIFTDVVFSTFGEDFLKGTLKGEKIENFDREIKEVSYEEVEIKKNNHTGWYETLLVFEV